MKAIELFAGIGGFRLACEEMGIKTIFANDLKPLACKVYLDVFGENELRIGDISNYISIIPPHDLLTAGFPCQPFSSAGKKNGIRDPRGTLFEKIVEILSIYKPKYFVLENVKRLLSMEKGEHFATILAKLSSLGYLVEWRVLNAMDFELPQNRQRIFITGIHTSISDNKPHLLGAEELNKFPEGIGRLVSSGESWLQITQHEKAFPEWGMAKNGKFVGYTPNVSSKSRVTVKLKDFLEDDVPCNFDFTETIGSRIKQNTNVNKYVQGVEIISNQGGGARMGYTIFGVNGVAPTLTASSSRHYERYKVGERYRRLTNVEYARIQGFPDNHCKAVSIYNQYELIGNAVPPQMVKSILESLFSKGKQFTAVNSQKDFFYHA